MQILFLQAGKNILFLHQWRLQNGLEILQKEFNNWSNYQEVMIMAEVESGLEDYYLRKPS
jgi:hypothetical protein